MTENKRFTVFQDSYDTIYIKDKDIYRGDGLRIGAEEYVKFENVLKVVDLLNEQYEEIEYLKPRANENSNYIEDLEEDIIHYRQENEQIKHLIKEAYETERTHIGKNTLKQLMEAIQ